MANEKPGTPPESKFAEVIRKGKEKRKDMQQQSERPASAQQDSLVHDDSITES